MHKISHGAAISPNKGDGEAALPSSVVNLLCSKNHIYILVYKERTCDILVAPGFILIICEFHPQLLQIHLTYTSYFGTQRKRAGFLYSL